MIQDTSFFGSEPEIQQFTDLGEARQRGVMEEGTTSNSLVAELKDHVKFATAQGYRGTVMPDDPIKHIVVLMLENRSFDHILGATPKVRAKYDLSGTNKYGRKSYTQQPGAARQVPDDPMHETKDVLIQLGGTGGIPPIGGFVQDYAQSYPQLDDPSEVMRYHDVGTLPAIHALANAFTVCDTWHSSVPGPTWVNRLFALSGTSLGRVKMPNGIMNLNLHWYDQPTIFDRLNEKSIGWKVYFGDTPLSLLFVHQWSPENAARHHHMMGFYQDAASDADKFPPFAFIEPAYMRPGANDAHPHDIIGADGLIASVYNAIRKNNKLSNSTLLIVLFDERGDFTTMSCLRPRFHRIITAKNTISTRYGVRVPAILISPYVQENGTLSDLLDHELAQVYRKTNGLQRSRRPHGQGQRLQSGRQRRRGAHQPPPRVDPSTEALAASPPVDALQRAPKRTDCPVPQL